MFESSCCSVLRSLEGWVVGVLGIVGTLDV